ncbi:MAG: four-carbon acid sugar kinase family protein [Opitutus sp.]
MKTVVVIADDLSGAAELAGAAFRHGLTAEVQTTFWAESRADVICVDTDTRAAAAEDAAECVAAVMREVVAAEPAWIFKKCDSVLRGSVTAEAREVARATRAREVLVVPANPSRGRIIRDGTYFVEGRPLHETEFARDPQDPRRSSLVLDLLGAQIEGWKVPDVATADDVVRLAQAMGANTLPVGAADFFEALLRVRHPRTGREGEKPGATPNPGRSKLLVCGSAFAWPDRRRNAERDGKPVFAWPHDFRAVVAALRSTGRALIGIGDATTTQGRTSESLTSELAASVQCVLGEISVDLVLLEGGATASAVGRKMDWSRLRASAGVDRALVEFVPAHAPGPAMIIKPGSYPWPAQVWP